MVSAATWLGAREREIVARVDPSPAHRRSEILQKEWLRLTPRSYIRYHAPPAAAHKAANCAEVAELADAQDSKSCDPCGHEGSTPSFGTNAGLNNPLMPGQLFGLTIHLFHAISVLDACVALFVQTGGLSSPDWRGKH